MSTNNFGYPPRRSARLSTHHSRPPPPPKATICSHLQFGWFNNFTDSPSPSPRASQDILRELLANSIVGGNGSEDREFVNRILASAERHRRTPDGFPPPSSFPRFPDLPAEIRKEIWLLSLPNRTIHLGDYEGDRICWNRRLSIPAPALACREAWDLIWPLMHEIFHRDPLRSRTGLEPAQNKRASWITPGDTLSLGYENQDALGVNTAYQDNIAVFRDIAIPLEQMERAVGFGWLPMMSRASSNFKFHLLERLGIIIHTIVIDIDDGPHLFGGFGEIEGNATLPFSNPVQYLNPDKIRNWDTLRVVYGSNFPIHTGGSNHDTHLAAVVDLRDKRRMAELFSLVSVNGGSPWRGCSRLDAIRDWNQAFCTDCLETWWENRIQVRAKEAMTKMKALEVWRTDGYRTVRDPPLEEIRESKLPELVPTVRFFIRFSSCHPPGINIHQANELMGPIHFDSCYAGMHFPGELSDEDL
ncbi:hypothetical protein CPLU01_04575 [Colletotrichum plurivorum]|uniref:2EXR domain-containing protein n=1 Tax=Colletotrichum plurivorum TaxID=2175906 RepID=A0A8H6NIQ8_9PEZI|nr:hypothetical protein CPLU01_04575 [Colletotrichum plurivorum]